MSFRCSVCDEVHEGFPAWGAPLPESAHAIPKAERDSRIIFDSDICQLDQKRLFVLGRLEIPVIGQQDSFCYLTWVELAEEHHDHWLDIFNLERRSHLEPIPGTVDSKFPGMEQLMGTEVILCLQDKLERPKIRSAFVKGPLAELQRKGIPFERACELDHQCDRHSPPQS